MRTVKYSLFGIIAMLFMLPVFGQSKILLMDNYFTCQGCKNRNPAISKKDVAIDIQKDSNLQQAHDKIIGYFTSIGDGFILHCETCPGRFIKYVNNTQKSQKNYNGFGTNLQVRSGGNQKGDDEFYQLEDILLYLTDTLLVFDSIQLSTASIITRDQAVLGNIHVSCQVQGKIIDRTIPYDAKRQVLTLSYPAIFGQGLSRTVTDTLPVSLSYYSPSHQQVIAPAGFSVFFASEEEKNDLAEWVSICRKEFPGWTTPQIAEALYPMLVCKYNNASMSNFINWLSKKRSLQK